MTAPMPAEPDESVRLRAEWLAQRACLLDPDNGFPTLSSLMDDLRRVLESGSNFTVFTINLAADRDTERIWGWQNYDRLLLEFTQRLSGDRGRGRVPEGLLCLPAIRSDEIFLFSPVATHAPDQIRDNRQEQAEDLDRYVRDFLAERIPGSDPFASFVGSAPIIFDPRTRVERLVYHGLRRARDEVENRRTAATLRGTEALRDIIGRNAIYPVFQPIFQLSTGTVFGFEALSRGPRESAFEQGEALFSFAERAELLQPLERVCRRRILEESRDLPAGQSLFVNLSPAAAVDADFLDGELERLVRQYSLEPSRIVVEITERTYALQQEEFTRILKTLRQEGFSVAVDDMGTGYSSFSSLASIDPDFLKFDTMFVHEIHLHRIKRDLLDAMLSFARKTETQVIAEGIETPEELKTLVELGVPYGQGFLLARPGPLPAAGRQTAA